MSPDPQQSTFQCWTDTLKVTHHHLCKHPFQPLLQHKLHWNGAGICLQCLVFADWGQTWDWCYICWQVPGEEQPLKKWIKSDLFISRRLRRWESASFFKHTAFGKKCNALASEYMRLKCAVQSWVRAMARDPIFGGFEPWLGKPSEPWLRNPFFEVWAMAQLHNC